MGALELSLGLFAIGVVLFWAGYYVALVTAWRAGVRGVGTVIALMAGLCCCGGVAVLAMHWEKIQRHTFEAIANGGDAAALGARLSRFRIASAVAVIGLVLQLVAGYTLPEDDGYGYEGYHDYDDSFSDGSYSDDSSADDAYDDSYPGGSGDGSGVDTADGEMPPGDAPAGEPAVAPEAEIDEPQGTEAPAGEAQPWANAASGIVAGLSRDGRAAFVLDPAGGRWVRRERGRITGIEPGMTVHAQGTSREDGVLVVSSIEDSGIAPWVDLPRPVRLEGALASPPSDRVGRWVIVPNVRANSTTQVMAADGSAVRVRAARGLIERDASYVAIRGALVDTRPVDRRGGVELWILREDDLIQQ